MTKHYQQKHFIDINLQKMRNAPVETVATNKIKELVLKKKDPAQMNVLRFLNDDKCSFYKTEQERIIHLFSGYT